MNQFRYNLAISVLFDNEQNTGEVEGFPVSIIESTEGKKRIEAYAWLRREIRKLMIHTYDIPRDVERKFRWRLKYLRYKTNTRIAGAPTFALVTIGRQTGSPRSAEQHFSAVRLGETRRDGIGRAGRQRRKKMR